MRERASYAGETGDERPPVEREVIVVGGGPAGSSCARRLVHTHGMDCLVLDREAFPRTKLCAGWITPEVVSDLDFDPTRYPGRFLTFESVRVHLRGLAARLHGAQHSIRRYEFDHYLLQQSGADIAQHYVRRIERRNGSFLIDGRYRCRFLVGAGGTRCPVYRHLFQAANPRAQTLQAATLEEEFPYPWQDGTCHLWFFDKGLPGYSWYVPKADGYLNIGLGGMSAKLKAKSRSLKDYWHHFTAQLGHRGLVTGHTLRPGGYSYYLRGGVETLQRDNAFLIGDAAGLSTRDLCEGIGPAVRSGLLAADAIASGGRLALESVSTYSLGNRLAHGLLERAFVS